MRGGVNWLLPNTSNKMEENKLKLLNRLLLVLTGGLLTILITDGIVGRIMG
jgi:hypothetical protein